MKELDQLNETARIERETAINEIESFIVECLREYSKRTPTKNIITALRRISDVLEGNIKKRR